jgi:hypothetical protein
MFDWFNDRRFGLLTVRLILLMAIGIAVWPAEPQAGDAIGRDVTVLSRVPLSELQDPAVHYGFQAAVVFACVLWLLNWLLPWSCWLAVLSFAGLAALRIENSSELCHSYWLLWILMLVHALWYSFYSGRLRSSDSAGRRCYPAWVLGLSVLAMAWFHSLSGAGKWLAADPQWTNGWVWADGVSLQLWLLAFGNPDSRLVQFLVQEVVVARAVQQVLLVIELTAILAIFTPTLRRLVGVALVLYYVLFLHCFVDWETLVGKWGLAAETTAVPSGVDFPWMSYAFFLFWVVWVFLIPDRILGAWERAEELPNH